MNFIFLTLVIWKAIDTLVSFAAQKWIPYLGFFSYGDQMFKYGLPDFIRKLSNFDGIMYARIASSGYSTTEQAFFPLYPLLIHIVNRIVSNPIISGVAISLTATLIGMVMLYKYLPHLTANKNIIWVLLALLTYPTSYYFGVMYTEGLFLALLVGTLFNLANGRLLLASILGFFLALTRVQGILVLIPIAVMAVAQFLQKKSWAKTASTALGPIFSIASYMTYLWNTTGNPVYFIRAQESFGANRSSHLIFFPQVIYRYLKIFFTADINFQYYVAVLEFGFVVLALTLLIYDLYLILKTKHWNTQRLGINLFSFANLLVPTMTGTLTSIPRYSLMSIAIFLVIGELKSKLLKYALLIIFAILHVIMLVLFIQGYYVT